MPRMTAEQILRLPPKARDELQVEAKARADAAHEAARRLTFKLKPRRRALADVLDLHGDHDEDDTDQELPPHSVDGTAAAGLLG